MKNTKYFSLIFPLTLSLFSVAGPSQAQLAAPVGGSNPWQVALKIDIPSRGAPGKREGKAARNCKPPTKDTVIFIGLVPEYRLALTAAERPTFWFYVPYIFDSPTATFTLKNAEEKEVYQAAVEIKGKPGVIGVSLPDSIPALEVGKKYWWEFEYRGKCPPESVVTDIGAKADGWLERVQLPFSEGQLESASPRERLEIYASAGLWFEILSELALQYRQQPENKQLQADWKDLIEHEAVNLPAEIVSAPVVDCCTIKQKEDKAK